jgi:type II secretory pathway pseudopilin PulG
MLMRKPFSKMTGLTLLETMFAIAIGALVLIGAVIFYLSTKQNANTTKTVADMNAIVSAYESYMAGGNTLTADIDIPALQTAGFLPSPLNTAWGQPYTATPTLSPASVLITVVGIGAAGTDGTGGDTNCDAIWNMVKSSQGVTQGTTDCSFTYPL